MNIDSTLVQCFIAVAETGSFTKAADRVNRTQSAVSQQINKLEHLLGKQLIIRSKQLSLTPDGELFLSYARQIFSLHCEAIDRFKEPELAGEVRLGIPDNFADIFLSDILADFQRIHPRILMYIESGLTIPLFERFKQRDLDIVLVKMNRPEDFPNGQDVWTDPLRWVGEKTLCSDDKPLPLIVHPHPCVYREAAIKALEKSGKAWRIVFSSPSHKSIIAAVKAGMGLTVMPVTMIPEELEPAHPSSALPKLEDTHVSLLKHSKEIPAINTLENFIIKKFKPQKHNG